MQNCVNGCRDALWLYSYVIITGCKSVSHAPHFNSLPSPVMSIPTFGFCMPSLRLPSSQREDLRINYSFIHSTYGRSTTSTHTWLFSPPWIPLLCGDWTGRSSTWRSVPQSLPTHTALYLSAKWTMYISRLYKTCVCWLTAPHHSGPTDRPWLKHTLPASHTCESAPLALRICPPLKRFSPSTVASSCKISPSSTLGTRTLAPTATSILPKDGSSSISWTTCADSKCGSSLPLPHFPLFFRYLSLLPSLL